MQDERKRRTALGIETELTPMQQPRDSSLGLTVQPVGVLPDAQSKHLDVRLASAPAA
jgi:hypothetical protein